jgi:hypothetical protein
MCASAGGVDEVGDEVEDETVEEGRRDAASRLPSRFSWSRGFVEHHGGTAPTP